MQCDMCGAEVQLMSAEVEGVKLQVCNKCARFGKVLHNPNVRKKKFTKSKNFHKKKKPEPEKEPLLLINSRYPQIVRKARESLKLTQEQFAKKLNEKESIIQHIEVGKFNPSIRLARKLEKILKVKLIQEIEDEDGKPMSDSKVKKRGGAVTIGDLIKIKK